MVVLYPATTPGRPETIGLYTLEVALDAPIGAGEFPLVLISHGTGGSPLVYRTLAHFLARQGFVVGLPQHHGNHRDDNTWQGTPRNLEARPRHLRLAIDFLFAAPWLAASLMPDTVGLIGHSLGGYTALALAGGRPTALPHEPANELPLSIPTTSDDRVRALVLLAPATPWYQAAGALREVRIPVLLLTAERDEFTPDFHAQIVLNGVADRRQVTHRVIKNAGHYSFLSPFPLARVSPAFPPSQDPPGFDRARFNDELNADVAAFLRRELLRH